MPSNAPPRHRDAAGANDLGSKAPSRTQSQPPGPTEVEKGQRSQGGQKPPPIKIRKSLRELGKASGEALVAAANQQFGFDSKNSTPRGSLTNSETSPLLPGNPLTEKSKAGSPTRGHAHSSSPTKTRNNSYSNPEEAALVATAREYSDREKLKAVKWFPARGTPIPTDTELEALEAARVKELKKMDRERREADRNRRIVEVGHLATVPCSQHPLYLPSADEVPQDSDRTPTKATIVEGSGEGQAVSGTPAQAPTAPKRDQPVFETSAAEGLQGRQLLQQRFLVCCFNAMLRARAEARLSKVLQVKNSAKSDASKFGAAQTKQQKAAARAELAATLPASLVLLDLPSCLPFSESSHYNNSGAASEEPSSTKVEQFKEKPLRAPFAFKQKDYTQLKFSEHHYANADLPENIAPLPAGLWEVAEPPAAPIVTTVQRATAHFVQPIVTLETLKAHPFPFSRTDPTANLIVGTEPQTVTDGAFQLGPDRVQHGQQIPSRCLHSDFATSKTLKGPLPKVIRSKRPEDSLSDSDDEGVELPSLHPGGLAEIASWLPAFTGGSQAQGGNGAASAASNNPLSTPANLTVETDLAATTSSLAPFASTVNGANSRSPRHASVAATALLGATTASTILPLNETGKPGKELGKEDDWLGWEPLPVHGMASRQKNVEAAEKRQALVSWTEQVLAAIPLATRRAI